MIVVLTKERHVLKIRHVCDELNIAACIYPDVAISYASFPYYSLGISYCWPHLVPPEALAEPSLGWYNYHPAPLPEWPGPRESERAIEEGGVFQWGVTLHRMNEKFDDGPIVECRRYPLWEPPTSIKEIGAVAHWNLFKLFRDTIHDLAIGAASAE